MPGIYDGDKTFTDWAKEVGNKGRSLRQALNEVAEQKQDWDGFKGARSNATIATDLGRTVAEIDDLENAINDANTIKRVAFGAITHSPAADLLGNIRKFT